MLQNHAVTVAVCSLSKNAANDEQSVLRPVPWLLMWRYPHLLLSAGVPAIDWFAADACTQQQICHCCCRPMAQTDRQTDTRPIHRPSSAYYTGSINNYTARLVRWFLHWLNHCPLSNLHVVLIITTQPSTTTVPPVSHYLMKHHTLAVYWIGWME